MPEGISSAPFNERAKHRHSSNVTLAERLAVVALTAAAGVDAERSKLYLDLLFLANTPKVFEAALNSLGYEYQSVCARRYVPEGKAEGRMEYRVETLILDLVIGGRSASGRNSDSSP